MFLFLIVRVVFFILRCLSLCRWLVNMCCCRFLVGVVLRVSCVLVMVGIIWLVRCCCGLLFMLIWVGVLLFVSCWNRCCGWCVICVVSWCCLVCWLLLC